MYTQIVNGGTGNFEQLSPTNDTETPLDLSSFISVGATGVCLFFENTNNGNATIGACHPSQVTMRTGSVKNNASAVAYVPVNASRVCNVYLGTGVNLYLVGEFDSDCEFLSQDIDKTPVSNGAWVSTSHSGTGTGETETAKFAIYNIVKSGDPDVGLTGVRHGDSTDDTQTTSTGTNTWAIVPLNASFECDLYKVSGYQFFLVGYINSGATAVEPPQDVSTATDDGTFQPITPTTTAEYYIVQYRGTHTADTVAGAEALLSESSSGTNALGKRPAGMHTGIIMDDGTGKIHQAIDSIDYDFFIVGSVTNAGAITVTDPIVSGSNFTITGSGFEASQGTGTVTVGGQAATISAWSDTSITASINIESTSAKYGANDVVVTNNSAESQTKAGHTVSPQANNGFVDMATLSAEGNRLTSFPDLATNDQVRYGNVLYQGGSPTAYTVSVADTGIFTVSGGPVPDGTYTFAVNAWDSGDTSWGTATNQTVIFGEIVSSGGIIKTIRPAVRDPIRNPIG